MPPKRKKKEPRIHIFWQRRIREGDVETPYWFPSETTGGAIKENRIVLPIPPGTHWSEAKPAILPGMENVNCRQIESSSEEQAAKPKAKREKKPVMSKPSVPTRSAGGLWFAPPKPPPPTPEEKAAMKAARGAAKKEKFKNDPKLVAAARELRDRYMEQVNVDPSAMLPPSACGKYDVSRQLAPLAAPTLMADAMKIEQVQAAPAVRMLEAA